MQPSITFSRPALINVSMRIAVDIVIPSNVKPNHEIDDEFGGKRKPDDGLVVSKGTEKHLKERI
jgi:hypothetical protein